ncbi:MAG TPA: hypothetical protein VKU36_05300 [Candidatus Babeliales bacterium]|nr:hypothetical protein [Candidatus Babeliales bacterium]
MRNIKNIFTIFVTLLTTQCIFSEPVIEIYNKTNESIQVDIADGSSRKDITTAYVNPNEQWNSGDRTTITLNTKLLMQVSTKANPSPKAFMIDAPGKTKYLSWDPAKSQPLYPQTGPLLGLLGKTKSGLSLSNNINTENIALTNPLAAPQMPKKPSQQQPAATQPKPTQPKLTQPTQPKPIQPIPTTTETDLEVKLTNATNVWVSFSITLQKVNPSIILNVGPIPPKLIDDLQKAYVAQEITPFAVGSLTPKDSQHMNRKLSSTFSKMIIKIMPLGGDSYLFAFDPHGKKKMFFKWDGNQLVEE